LKNEIKKLLDLNKTELFILSSLVFPIIFFGFYPEPLLNTVEVSIKDLIETYNVNLKINLIETK
jgi:NADH-quinone oxidoreductase subunit M